MNENINLCEILKGHEGETFYSPVFGNIELVKLVNFNGDSLIEISHGYYLNSFGCLNSYHGECIIFPSKDQRDWNKWAEEQKPKTPKIWSELVDESKAIQYTANTYLTHDYDRKTPIEKAALALLKIHQLIEIGYGGNITNEEWKDPNIDKYAIKYEPSLDSEFDPNINICHTDIFSHITFRIKEQAEEFLSYLENIQLLKDFYMI